MPKFWTKTTLVRYYQARSCKQLLPYFKSAPSNLRNFKILRKNKNAKIWDQKCLIWLFLGCNLKTILSYSNMTYLAIFNQKCLIWVFFGQNFKKTVVIFEISTLEFVRIEPLTHTVNFGIGWAFPEGLGLGPDPFYQVCPWRLVKCLIVLCIQQSILRILLMTGQKTFALKLCLQVFLSTAIKSSVGRVQKNSFSKRFGQVWKTSPTGVYFKLSCRFQTCRFTKNELLFRSFLQN